jgi:glutathione S-transferase
MGTLDCILHHFDLSPFAEKVRLAFGLKGLAWQSVEIPIVMPKPDLTALTGGYRKTPVLQIGADIFCDTQRIARELEQRVPLPPLFPQGSEGLCMALAHWSDTAFFRPGAALSMGTNTALPDAIVQDRQAFFSFMNFASLAEDLPHLYAGFRAQLQVLETMLRDRRDFLLGGQPSWADLQGYFPVWMCRGNIAGGAELMASLPALRAWEQRVRAIGHGQRSELSAAAALALARASEPTAERCIVPDARPPLQLGDNVAVTPEDYGAVPVYGQLWRLTHEEVAVRREHELTGAVVVHFPRAGYRVEKR